MLPGVWPGECRTRSRLLAEGKLLPVDQGLIGVGGPGHIGGADQVGAGGRLRQFPAAGDMVGLEMGVEDILELGPVARQQGANLFEVPDRVDHHRLAAGDQHVADAALGDPIDLIDQRLPRQLRGLIEHTPGPHAPGHAPGAKPLGLQQFGLITGGVTVGADQRHLPVPRQPLQVFFLLADKVELRQVEGLHRLSPLDTPGGELVLLRISRMKGISPRSSFFLNSPTAISAASPMLTS